MWNIHLKTKSSTLEIFVIFLNVGFAWFKKSVQWITMWFLNGPGNCDCKLDIHNKYLHPPLGSNFQWFLGRPGPFAKTYCPLTWLTSQLLNDNLISKHYLGLKVPSVYGWYLHVWLTDWETWFRWPNRLTSRRSLESSSEPKNCTYNWISESFTFWWLFDWPLGWKYTE